MTVQVEMTPEQEAAVSEVAARNGLSVSSLLAGLAHDLLLDEQNEERILQERIADADRGDFLTSEQMAVRFGQMLSR